MKNKYTIWLLLVIFMGLSTQINVAQSQRNTTLTLNDKTDSVSLEQLLRAIEKTNHIVFLYDANLIEGKTVPRSVLSSNIDDMTEKLGAILQSFGLSYHQEGERSYVIYAKEDVTKNIQNGTLQGEIIDRRTGDPLPGVNVYLPELELGAASEVDGTYQVSDIPEGNHAIRATFVGYRAFEDTVQITADEVTTLNIQMVVSDVEMDELVVSGLASSIKRENMANSVSKIDANELTGGTTPSTTASALAGKVVGANISSTGGAPGGGMDFKLRGISTLGSGSSQPLIIVDGVYINNNQLQNGLSAVSQISDPNQDDGANRLADLNPDDIQSIEVLKGPSAAAIYGARANAGVVIIETKRGVTGDTQISFNQSVGFASVLNKLDKPRWSEDKIDLVYGAGTSLAQMAKGLYSNSMANDNMHDYQDFIFGNHGTLLDTEIKISGGDSQTQFLVSGEFKRDEGIIENTGFDRYSIRANLDHRFAENIIVRSSSNYINSQTQRGWAGNGGVGSVIYALAYTPPFAQLLPDSEANYPDNPFYQMNPLELIEYGENTQDVNRLLQSLSADIGLYHNDGDELKLKIDGGIDFMDSNSLVYQPGFIQYQENQNNPGDVIRTAEKDLNINLSAFLVYNLTVESENTLWNLETQLGYTTFHRQQELQQMRGRGLVAGQTNVQNATIQEIFNQFSANITDVGFVGQQRVNWEDKVIGTLGVRFDKSTLNMDQDRYYFFPKASVAINLTNFPFWNIDLMNQFKLRTAYGETGGLPNFGVIFDELSSGNISGNLGTYRSTRTIDPNLEPETAEEFEVGADIGFWDSRISLEATYYQKNVRNLILDEELPGSSGLQVQATNAADLQNRGIELSLKTTPVQNNNLTWNTTLNWSRNRAEITNLKISPLTTGAFGASLGTFYIAEGFSPTTIVGTPFDEQANRYTKYGSSQPDFQISFYNGLSFLKNWQFSFLWQFKYDQKTINLHRYLGDLNGTTPDWNEDYDGDGMPNGVDRKGEGAARYIEDTTYLKLREASLYYTVPTDFLNKFTGNAVKKVQFGVSGNNLLLFSPYSSYDPETSEFGAGAIQTGVAVAPYPSSRQLMFHFKFDF